MILFITVNKLTAKQYSYTTNSITVVCIMHIRALISDWKSYIECCTRAIYELVPATTESLKKYSLKRSRQSFYEIYKYMKIKRKISKTAWTVKCTRLCKKIIFSKDVTQLFATMRFYEICNLCSENELIKCYLFCLLCLQRSDKHRYI